MVLRVGNTAALQWQNVVDAAEKVEKEVSGAVTDLFEGKAFTKLEQSPLVQRALSCIRAVQAPPVDVQKYLDMSPADAAKAIDVRTFEAMQFSDRARVFSYIASDPVAFASFLNDVYNHATVDAPTEALASSLLGKLARRESREAVLFFAHNACLTRAQLTLFQQAAAANLKLKDPDIRELGQIQACME